MGANTPRNGGKRPFSPTTLRPCSTSRSSSSGWVGLLPPTHRRIFSFNDDDEQLEVAQSMLG